MSASWWDGAGRGSPDHCGEQLAERQFAGEPNDSEVGVPALAGPPIATRFLLKAGLQQERAKSSVGVPPSGGPLTGRRCSPQWSPDPAKRGTEGLPLASTAMIADMSHDLLPWTIPTTVNSRRVLSTRPDICLLRDHGSTRSARIDQELTGCDHTTIDIDREILHQQLRDAGHAAIGRTASLAIVPGRNCWRTGSYSPRSPG